MFIRRKEDEERLKQIEHRAIADREMPIRWNTGVNFKYALLCIFKKSPTETLQL